MKSGSNKDFNFFSGFLGALCVTLLDLPLLHDIGIGTFSILFLTDVWINIRKERKFIVCYKLNYIEERQ